jgi:hypothetical protein
MGGMNKSGRGSATNSGAMRGASILAAKIVAAILTAAGALACLVPALEMNLAAHAARGGPWYEAAPYLAGVFVAAAAGAILPIAKRARAGEVIFACILLATIAISFNMKNAMTSSTLARAEFADPRKAQMERIAILEDRRKMLAEMLAQSSQQSPLKSSQEWRAELAAKEADPIFTRADRSARCTNSTVAASAKFCAERAGILAAIARAEEHEKAEAELADIRRELAGIGTRPTVADPIVTNLASTAALFMPVSKADYAVIGWANDLHTALFVELAAALGPMIFVFLIGTLWRSSGAAQAAVAVNGRAKSMEKPATAASVPQKAMDRALPANMPACVRRFLEGQVVEAAGAKIGAGELYAAYVAGCDGEAVSQNKFGRLAGKLFEKDGGRYPAYVGVALRGPRLAVARSEPCI